MNSTTDFPASDDAACSLVVGFSETTKDIHVRHPHTQFRVWKGRDVWHQDISVQIRLDDDGSVFVSTQEGHVSTLRIARITLEKLHVVIRGIIAENASDHPARTVKTHQNHE